PAAARPHPGRVGTQHRDAHRNGGARSATARAWAPQRRGLRGAHRPCRERRRPRGRGPMSEPRQAVVVTGLSGSGKSTALRVLEDLGFYCVDNLPVALLPRFVELWEASREELHRVAFGIDARERLFLGDFESAFDELRRAGVRLEVVYL